MFSCPKCGAKLVSGNLSHACGDFSIDRFLAGKGPKARALFERFERMAARCGPYEVAPAKTRVAFMAQVRWASVNRVTDEHLDVHFVLPRKLSSPRLRRVETVGPVFVHHLRLSQPEDFDDQLQRWLQASRDEYGERSWISRQARRRGTRT